MARQTVEVRHEVDGITISARVAQEHEEMARTVMSVMSRPGPKIADDGQVTVESGRDRLAAGTPMWWGFSEATPVEVPGGYELVTPDFVADPPARSNDLTPLLEIRDRMMRVALAAGVAPDFTAAPDLVVFAKDWENHGHLTMTRTDPREGDSGWFVQPAGHPEPEGGWTRDHLVGHRAWTLLKEHPELVWAMALPVGYLVEIQPGRIERIFDPDGRLVASNLSF